MKVYKTEKSIFKLALREGRVFFMVRVASLANHLLGASNHPLTLR